MAKLSLLVCGLFVAILCTASVPSLASAHHDTQTSLAAPDGSQGNGPLLCFPAIFALGDSLFDKGNDLILHPLRRGFAYNETYMSRPRDMEREGRLLIDFIAQAFGLVSPSPYMQSVTPNYKNGVNLATFGATISGVCFMNPYTLDIQSYWLRRFFENVERASNSSQASSPTESLPTLEGFAKGLYVIAAGGNDYTALAREMNQSMSTVRANVTQVVSKLNDTIVNLMGAGATSFLIINIPPIGCSPLAREAFFSAPGGTNINARAFDLDRYGCLRPLNEVIAFHNTQLQNVLHDMRNQHQDKLFVYADYNGVIKQMLSSRLAATIAGSCRDGNSAGCYNNIHITSEAANRLATQEFLNGDFLEPRGIFSHCNLNLRLN